MARLLTPAALLLATLTTASAAPVPGTPADPTKDRDGFPLPAGATARLGSVLSCAPGPFGNLTFSPDNRRMLAASWDGRVFTWDADSGKFLRAEEFPIGKHPSGTVSGVVAGDRVVWIVPEGGKGQLGRATAVAFDVAGGAELSRFQLPSWVSLRHDYDLPKAVVAPNGRHLAVVSGPREARVGAMAGAGAVEVYETATGRQLHSQKLAEVNGAGVTVSPDSKTLLVRESSKPVRRFDLATGKELDPLADVDLPPRWFVFSPDGKRFVGLGQTPRPAPGPVPPRPPKAALVIYDAATGKPTGRLETGDLPYAARFLGPDSLLVQAHQTGGSPPFRTTLSRWDLATGKRVWETERLPTARLTASPDGRRVVAIIQARTLKVYDDATGQSEGVERGHGNPVAWAGFSPDGQTVTTADTHDVRVWAPDGTLKRAVAVPELIVSPEQRDVQPAALVWPWRAHDRKTREVIGWDADRATIGWRLPHTGGVDPRVVSHDGRRVVVVPWGSAPLEAVVYDGPSGKELSRWPMPPGRANGRVATPPPLALSGDGRLLFVEGEAVVGVDVETGKVKAKLTIPMPRGWTGAPAVSADGGRLAVGTAAKIRVYDVASDKILSEYPTDHTAMWRVGISPDGRRVIGWSSTKNLLWVWDVGSDAKPRVLDGGYSPPNRAAFNRDGSKLVVGYQDGTSLIWDLAKQ